MKNKLAEAVRDSFFKLSHGHFAQGVAYIIMLVIILIVYFNTSNATENINITNLQETKENLNNMMNLIKYGSLTSLIILMISTFYLSTIDVKLLKKIMKLVNN
jgi:hypothetical protein